MKKYLYSALALPLLFACSSEDLSEQAVVSNDQFAGIEKVDATFSLADEGTTRMATKWTLEEGDKYGFAWLGDGTIINATNNPADYGKAFQNHPLTQTGGIFKPATSIYVGKYYIYRPYDETVVDVEAINFKSLEEQPLVEGMASAGDAWKGLAKSAIIIGDKWTNVTKVGTPDATDPTFIWDKAGIDQHYNIYAAVFSNQTGLDLTYTKNNVAFDGKKITGATDIDYTYPAGSTIGAADIYKAEVTLTGAAKSFTYAPTAEPNGAAHDGSFWADKHGAVGGGVEAADGFAFTAGAITLNAPGDNGYSTEGKTSGWFWFNSLPATAGGATNATNVTTVLSTSYGVVTVTKALKDCAYAFEQPDGAAATAPKQWIKIAAAQDLTKTPQEWVPEALPAGKNTFINHYGNHKGKYSLTVDFSDGVMDGMDIKNDAHLQKALKYYIASGKGENPVVLDLQPASATDNSFKLSKISIALLQTINKAATKVTLNAAGVKVIVTQDGQADLGLAAKKEVPALDKVFNAATDVFLSKDCEWTWAGGADAKTALPVDANVTSITNEGTLTVNATNIELSVAGKTLANAKGATMKITKVTTVKNALTNLGTINVGSASDTTPELRAYGVAITNDATTLDDHGVINNYGVVGVTAGVLGGSVNNYGLIDMKSTEAITLLTTNELVSDFDDHFAAATNKMGTVVLPEGQPNALVSVSNGAETGFIEYTWTGATYVTPNNGTVKYNTIVVSSDIKFTAVEDEIKYIKFNGTRTQVTNPYVGGVGNKLTSLKGVIINPGKSIIIEKDNGLDCANGAFLGAGATVYKGGTFNHNATVVGTTASNYFGDWQTTQIVEY